MTVILTILASLLIFGLIILIHELGHFSAAKLSGIRVHEFALGMGPAIIKWKRKETLYAIRLFPIGGFVSMGEDEESEEEGSFNKAPVGRRILVIAAGAVMNLVLGFFVVVGLTASSELVPTRTVLQFQPDAITAESGLMEGDTILALNGRKMYVMNDILYEMMRIKGDTADVVVERGGERVELRDVRFDITPGEGGVNDFNLDFVFLGVEKTFGNVLEESWMYTLSLIRLVFVSVFDLVTGNVAINQMSGPVGIIDVISQAVAIDFSVVFRLLAMISVNLGVMNILPLPALDGGRLVLLLIEAVTKKRLNPKYEGYIHLAGFVLLIAMMLFVTFNDITKLFNR